MAHASKAPSVGWPCNMPSTIWALLQTTAAYRVHKTFKLFEVLATIQACSLKISVLIPVPHFIQEGKMVKVCGFLQRPRWQVSRPQGAQTWITQFNLQTTPCLPLVFIRIHQMAPPRTVVATSSCSLLLIYRPRKDERLSRPTWLTYRVA